MSFPAKAKKNVDIPRLIPVTWDQHAYFMQMINYTGIHFNLLLMRNANRHKQKRGMCQSGVLSTSRLND